MANFLAKKNGGRGSSNSRPCPNIVSFIHKWCTRGTCKSSCSVLGLCLYSRDSETRSSCFLQTATRTHCNEFVVLALNHKDQWRENSGNPFLHMTYSCWRRIKTKRKRRALWKYCNISNCPLKEGDMVAPYRKDCSQSQAHVRKDLFFIQKWAFNYKY
jgi:hypothetical protein